MTRSFRDGMSRARSYLARWLRWEPCRGIDGCAKMLLLALPIPIPVDCYLLRYLDGSEVQPHRDFNELGRHYRMNIILKAPRAGGEFRCAQAIYDRNRVKFFRADTLHSVSKVQGGPRYVLSVGWVLQ